MSTWMMVLMGDWKDVSEFCERKVLKSWVPSRNCAASCMAGTFRWLKLNKEQKEGSIGYLRWIKVQLIDERLEPGTQV